MTKKKSNHYVYEDDFLLYESSLKNFTKEKFDEFNAKAEKIDLQSRIKDLMNLNVVNSSENQSALHTQYRQMHKLDNKNELPDNFMISAKNYNFSDTFYKNIEKEILKEPNVQINIVSIGIGGSYEGPKLMFQSNEDSAYLSSKYHTRNRKLNFEFLTGPNSKEFEIKVDHLDPKKTFFIIFSKSFKSIETIQMLKMALSWSNCNTNNILAITSNVEEPKKYGISHIHTFDKEIGGRYSIWLEDIESLYGGRWTSDGRFLNRGGSVADKRLLSDEKYLDFVKYLSFSDIWMNNFNNKHIRVVLSYIWNLRSFPDYVQQLEMESLGKPPNKSSEFKKTGQVIFGGYGPIAEHSYFQLLHQGTQELCADIIACNQDKNHLEYIKAITQSKLLSEGAEHLSENEKVNGNVPVNMFFLKSIDSPMFEKSLGYLIATWEHRTFLTATMLGINPFDQFGVIAGKKYSLSRKFIKNS